MVNMPDPTPFEFTPQGAEPADYVVEGVLAQLRNDPASEGRWQEILNANPRIGEFISRRARELAPDDLILRGEIVKSMLGALAVDGEYRLIDSLEADLSFELENVSSPADLPASGGVLVDSGADSSNVDRSLWRRIVEKRHKRAETDSSGKARGVSGLGTIAMLLLPLAAMKHSGDKE